MQPESARLGCHSCSIPLCTGSPAATDTASDRWKRAIQAMLCTKPTHRVHALQHACPTAMLGRLPATDRKQACFPPSQAIFCSRKAHQLCTDEASN